MSLTRAALDCSGVATRLQRAPIELGEQQFLREAAMRARYPDTEGFIERDGVKVGYEVFGEGESAVVFPPVDGLVNSRCWKAQVPYLARASRVVTIDPRGNGRSDRPQSAAAYADTEFVADTIAVMDATGVDRAVLVGHCTSSWYSLLCAVQHPARVLGVVAVEPWTPYLTPPLPARQAAGARAADDHGSRAADRPGIPPVPRRTGGARVRARPLPAPSGLRPRGRAGRPDHHHGTHR